MNAPLLGRVSREITMAKSQREATCLSAQKGIYLARTGSHEAAVEISNQIRTKLGSEIDTEIYVWLTLLEGIIGFYSSASTREKNRILRAYAVAKAARRIDLEQYAAAWLAHQDFNAGKYREMIHWLLASGLSDAINPSARIRACLTIADAWQCVGDEQASSSWYSIVRKNAADIGDRASIMASIENRAAMKLDRLWLKSIDQDIELESVLAVETELLGGLGYEKFTRSEALLYQAPIWRFRLELIKGNNVQALEYLMRSTVDSVVVDTSLAWSHESDMAWIYHKIGSSQDAKIRFELALDTPVDRLDHDDAAVYWRRMSILDSDLFEGARSEEFCRKSHEALQAFENDQVTLKKVLLEIDR
jgi:hypothetical protein